jgi:hypothetical protein
MLRTWTGGLRKLRPPATVWQPGWVADRMKAKPIRFELAGREAALVAIALSYMDAQILSDIGKPFKRLKNRSGTCTPN